MRKLMWFTIGFGVACAFCTYFVPDVDFVTIFLVLGMAVLTGVGTIWVKELRRVAVAFLGIAVGFGWIYTYEASFLQPAKDLDGVTQRQEIIVRDYPFQNEYGFAVDGEIFLDNRLYQVRVYLEDDYDLEPGNRLIGSFRFRYTSNGGKDEVLYHRTQGIFLIAYQKGNLVVERFWSEPLICVIPQWRSSLLDLMEEIFPEDVSGFCQALLLGNDNAIDYETATAFTVCGTRHVIAVSGLHVSMLFGLIYLITVRKRALTALLGIPVLILFAALVGLTPSVVRAAILQILMMLAMLFEKEYDQPTALSFAALVMLVIDPLVIASVSFQLSFACMVGIAMLSQPIKGWMLDEKRLGRFRGRWAKPLASSVAVSLSALVFTTPLVAIYFGVVSLISVISNLLTLWMITIAFYGILLCCLAGMIVPVAGVWVGNLLAWPVRYVLEVTKLLAKFPLAAVYTRSGYIVAWLVLVYVLLGVYVLAKKKPAALLTSLMAASLGVCLICSWAEPWLSDCRMTMLDVGQGQAILLQSSGRTYLVDCGGDYRDEAADITAETLLSQGITRLDGIILTHYDRDHSGGLKYLLTRIETQMLVLPAIEDPNGVGETLRQMTDGAVMYLDRDIQISYDDTILTIFAPEHDNLGNEGSICVLFQQGNSDILITGDRGIAGEKILMHDHDLPQVDVLVAGHHGSKNSTSQELLDEIQPTYVFISVGEENFYGHPAQELLKRLEEMGCMIYRTDEDGTIVYRG